MQTTNWLWPVPYTTSLSRGYFYYSDKNFHKGIDISTSGISGQKVYASKDGIVSNIYNGCNNVNALVTSKDCNSDTCSCNNLTAINYYDEDDILIDTISYCNWGLGNAVYIKHDDTTYSQYVHLENIYVTPNQVVKKGDLVGTVGSTGESSGAHLHLSLSTNNNASGRYNNNTDVIDYENSVEVTFDLNYNGSEPIYRAYEPGVKYGYMPPDPTRANYSFEGWYTERTGGTLFDVETIVPDENHTVYAHWKEKVTTVSVTFNANGGTVSPTSGTVTVGSTYSNLPTPLKTGYTFEGWYSAETGGVRLDDPNDPQKVTNANDHTIYAHWNLVAVGITLVLNGGSFASNTSVPSTLYYGESYATLPDPVKTGYTFKGWFTAESGGTRVDDPENPATVNRTDSHALYARWQPRSVTVTLYAKTGAVFSNGESVQNVEKTYGTTYGELPTPTRTGYSFTGWSNSLNGEIIENIENTTILNEQPHNLYAQWTPNNYSVTLNYNDGRSSETKSVPFGSPYGDILAEYPRTGYSFLGWRYDDPDSNAEPVIVCEGTIVSIPADHTLDLYWDANTYAIILKYNDGVTPDQAICATYDSEIGQAIPYQVYREGYAFNGWWDDCTGEYYNPLTVMKVAYNNLVLTAHWLETVELTLDYNRYGGVMDKIYEDYEVLPGRKYVVIPSDLSDLSDTNGAVVEGWYTARIGGYGPYDAISFVSIDEDHTLYAHWTNGSARSVTLDANGGICEEVFKTVTCGSAYGELPVPTKENASFLGWYLTPQTTDEEDIEITAETCVTSPHDHVIYARWGQVKISFNSAGGSDCGHVYRATNGTYGDLPVPVREGSVFDGWYYNGVECTPQCKLRDEEDHTLTAKWLTVGE